MRTSIITITTLIALSISQLCLGGSRQNSSTEDPWPAIIHMVNRSSNIRWQRDILVKLRGSYTPEDSLMVKSSIDKFNTLSETINICFSDIDGGNFEIYFLDSTNIESYKKISTLNMEDTDESSYFYISLKDKGITDFKLALQLSKIPNDLHQNFITNKLLFSLWPKNLDYSFCYANEQPLGSQLPHTIFNYEQPSDKTSQYCSEPEPFDINLIKTVYASNYMELFLLNERESNTLSEWIYKNATRVLIIPFLIALFILTGLLYLLYKKKIYRIKNRFLRFNVISIISLISIGFLSSIYFVISDNMIQNRECIFYINHNLMHDIIGFSLILLSLGLFSLNIIRKIESVINRRESSRFLHIALLFLSTGLIPIITIIAAVVLGTSGVNILFNGDAIKFLTYISIGLITVGALRALVSFFMLKEQELKEENRARIDKLNILKTKAELNALHSKINPHFLYNSLNSIAGLARTDVEKTEKMALSLSKLFRYSINKEQTDWSSFAEEIEMVNIYLDIEKIRFDDRLSFSIDLPKSLETAKLPRFIIQPLVENAIKHGVSKLVTEGEIKILIKKTDKFIEIVVADNGPDFPKDIIPGFGLQSIYDKLEIIYSNNFELHFINTPNKQIVIKLSLLFR